jgi:hypothetical protein
MFVRQQEATTLRNGVLLAVPAEMLQAGLLIGEFSLEMAVRN